MTEETLFDPNKEEEKIEVDPTKDYFKELVGDTKKFKDEKALAKSKYESDLYIKILEKRLDDMREDYGTLKTDYEARAKLEEYIDQLAVKQPVQPISNTLNANGNNEKPEINTKDIEELVNSKLKQHELSKKQTENFSLVMNRLKERYGDKYQDVLKEQIVDLGLDQDSVNDLAKNRPAAFIKLFSLNEVDNRENFRTPPRSVSRNDPFAPSSPKRNYAYYQKIRTENKSHYYDPKIAIQMQNDAIEQGDDFYK